jgi:predicted acylesterase/phospholipase RssA
MYKDRQAVACVIFAMLTMLAMAGCATIAQRQQYAAADLLDSTVAGYAQLRFFADETGDLQAALGWQQPNGRMPPIKGGRFDILALSSGGPDGAYGAGALKGMTAAGTRPQYEIVTGVSTGAIIAPFAFVGADTDADLESIYASDALANVLGRPSLLAAATGPALYPAGRIPQFIERHIDEALLRRVAAEHESGRRLLIATANLDTNQLTIWNMGRIAQLGGETGLTLFRQVLRAAIAIPGALAPVEIASNSNGRTLSEIHVDAGVLAYFYAEPQLVPPSVRRKARLDILLHNQLEAPPDPVEQKTIQLAGRSVSTLTRTAMRLLLDNTLNEAAKAGISVRYAYLPTEWRTVSSLEFDSQYMRATFDLGYRNALSGKLWQIEN